MTNILFKCYTCITKRKHHNLMNSSSKSNKTRCVRLINCCRWWKMKNIFQTLLVGCMFNITKDHYYHNTMNDWLLFFYYFDLLCWFQMMKFYFYSLSLSFSFSTSFTSFLPFYCCVFVCGDDFFCEMMRCAPRTTDRPDGMRRCDYTYPFASALNKKS